MTNAKKKISIVVPLYNEEEMIPELVRRIGLVSSELDSKVDIVCVDDGSRDDTASCFVQAASQTSLDWRLVKLSRNFGQQGAYRAGLEYAHGDAVVFLDADLQDPPENIPELESAWKAGARVVVGIREGRRETGIWRMCFDLFHFIFDRLTHGAMPRNSGTFGLMDRKVADQLKQLREVNLFLPALRCWFGFEIHYIHYQREERVAGQRKQTFRSLLNYAWDGITSFSNLPLRLITVLGCAVAFPSFLYGAWLVLQRTFQFFGFFESLEVLGFTTIAAAVFFMGGIQLICLGILGEYMARLFSEIKGRPVFIVDEVLSRDHS